MQMVFRYHLGEGITKKESDLAAEVEQQQQALKDKAAEKKAQGPQEAAPQPEEQQIPSVKVLCVYAAASFMSYVRIFSSVHESTQLVDQSAQEPEDQTDPLFPT